MSITHSSIIKQLAYKRLPRLVMFLVIVFILPVLADAAVVTVSGTVDTSGGAISGRTVTIYKNGNTTPVGTTTTDALGAWSVAGVTVSTNDMLAISVVQPGGSPIAVIKTSASDINNVALSVLYGVYISAEPGASPLVNSDFYVAHPGISPFTLWFQDLGGSNLAFRDLANNPKNITHYNGVWNPGGDMASSRFRCRATYNAGATIIDAAYLDMQGSCNANLTQATYRCVRSTSKSLVCAIDNNQTATTLSGIHIEDDVLDSTIVKFYQPANGLFITGNAFFTGKNSSELLNIENTTSSAFNITMQGSSTISANYVSVRDSNLLDASTNFSVPLNPPNSLDRGNTTGWFTAPFNFSLSNGGNRSVVQGASVTNTITASLVAGNTQAVSYSTTGLPAGATATYSPTSCSPGCTTTMNITTAASTPAGSYTITVTGTAGALTRTTTFTLTVSSAGYLVSGTVYTNEGVTNIGAGKQVRVLVNGLNPLTTTTNASGQYTFPAVPFVKGDIITVYIYNDAGNKGVTVTSAFARSLAGNITGLHIYKDHTIVRSEDSYPITAFDMNRGNNGDADITALYSDGSSGIYVAGKELYIWPGVTFAPTDVATIQINGSLEIPASAYLVMNNNNLIVLQNFENSGTVRASRNVNFTLTQDTNSGTFEYVGDGTASAGLYSLGSQISVGLIPDYYNLVINDTDISNRDTFRNTGAGGSTLVVGNNFTVSSGTFDGYIAPSVFNDVIINPAGIWIGANTASGYSDITGNFTRTGTFTHNNGTINFKPTTSSTITGATTWGTLTFADTSNNGSAATIRLADNQTVSVSAHMNGLDGNDLLAIRSSVAGSARTITFNGSSTFPTKTLLDVQDNTLADTSTGMTVPANPSLSVNSGNTVNWFTVGPGAPGTPDMTALTDLGPSNTDNVTSDRTPDFYITCTSGNTVFLYRGATQVGSSTCTAGNVTITSSQLAFGVHSITARQRDTFLNMSPASPALSITIDGSYLLQWNSTGASNCTFTNFSYTNVPNTIGSVTVFPLVTTTYSVTCSNSGGSTTRSVTIPVS